MHYLYGLKPGQPSQLVATFDSEEQLRAYVQWATLSGSHDLFKFEQGSALAGFRDWTLDTQPRAEDQGQLDQVVHNPSPSML